MSRTSSNGERASQTSPAPSISESLAEIAEALREQFYSRYYISESSIFPRPTSPVYNNFPESPSPPSPPSPPYATAHTSPQPLTPVAPVPNDERPSTPRQYYPLNLHEYADMTFNSAVYRQVVDRTMVNPALAHQIMHLDDTLRTMARVEEELRILTWNAFAYWRMVDHDEFHDLIMPVVIAYEDSDACSPLAPDAHFELPEDFTHTVYYPAGSSQNPIPVDVDAEAPRARPGYRNWYTEPFRDARHVPYCEVHGRRGHSTYSCAYYKCPNCDKLNPRHAPYFCPGNPDEPSIEPWGQEAQGY